MMLTASGRTAYLTEKDICFTPMAAPTKDLLSKVCPVARADLSVPKVGTMKDNFSKNKLKVKESSTSNLLDIGMRVNGKETYPTEKAKRYGFALDISLPMRENLLQARSMAKGFIRAEMNGNIKVNFLTMN